MKKLITVLLLLIASISYGQLYVPAGEVIFTTSTDEVSSAENVTNNGTIYSVEMNNTSAQTISGTGTMRYLKANNSADISLLSSHYVTNNGITLTSGKIILGNYGLTVASVTNDSATRYIKTNGSGALRMNATTGAYTKFPVGNTTYNYVRIYNNNASADTFSVRVQDTLYSNAGNSTGSFNNSVNRTWILSKTAANSGTGVNIEFNWNSSDVKGTLTNAVLYEYNGTKWIKANGTQSVSGNQITVTGYTGTLSSKQFMVSSSLGATLSVAASACQNTSGINITFSGSGGSAPYTFTYTLNGGSNQTVTTTSGSSVTGSVITTAAGNQVFSLVDVSDANLQNAVSDSATINIKATSTSTQSATACGSYVWNGTTYTTSGAKTWTGTNAAGCDSVATLNLTINSSTSSSVSETACDSYTWHGSTYTTSGAYTWTGTNANNCDSVVTLNLTINYGTHNATSQTACETYTWHGTAYTTSGDYTYSYTNGSGCASVDTLHLTINYGTHNATSQTACETYTWHGAAYTASGDYTYSYTNGSGCASVDTLHLTINYGTHNATSQTACDSYTWHGTAYTTSGDYTYSYTNGSGCASVDTLHLTITSSTTNITTVSACNSYTWTYNSTLYTSTGVYNVTTGCHTEVLNLTINNCNVTPVQPGIIQGGGDNNNICKYVGTDSILTYYVDAQPTTAQYVWYFPANVVKIIDNNGNEINYNPTTGYTSNNQIRIKLLVGFLNIPNVQKTIVVKGKSSTGIFGPSRTKSLMSQAPITPDVIVANLLGPICNAIIDPEGVTQTAIPVTYRIPKVISASSYNWYVDPSQASNVIIEHPNGSGANDTVITMKFTNSFTSCNLYVQSVNPCGANTPRSYLLLRSTPSAPGIISGPISICTYMAPNGQIATYSVPSTTGVLQYNWSIPTGSLSTTGQGTRTLSFLYPSEYTGGTISVTAQNACGTGSARSITTSRTNPENPSSIDVSPVSTCPNRVIDYSIGRMPTGATYVEWTWPSSAVSVTGQGTTSIRVTYGGAAVNGSVTVRSRNECMIYSSTSSSVAVKLATCSAFTGTTPEATIKATAETMDVKVSPNPTTSSFNVLVGTTTPTTEKISVRILDVQGRPIKSLMVMPNESINLGSDLKSGAYMLEVKQGGVKKTTRVVKY